MRTRLGSLRVQEKLSFTGYSISALPSMTSSKRKSSRRSTLGFNGSSRAELHCTAWTRRSNLTAATPSTTVQNPKTDPSGDRASPRWTHHPLSPSSTTQGFQRRHLSKMTVTQEPQFRGAGDKSHRTGHQHAGHMLPPGNRCPQQQGRRQESTKMHTESGHYSAQ